jgi:hypothetical protein
VQTHGLEGIKEKSGVGVSNPTNDLAKPLAEPPPLPLKLVIPNTGVVRGLSTPLLSPDVAPLPLTPAVPGKPEAKNAPKPAAVALPLPDAFVRSPMAVPLFPAEATSGTTRSDGGSNRGHTSTTGTKVAVAVDVNGTNLHGDGRFTSLQRTRRGGITVTARNGSSDTQIRTTGSGGTKTRAHGKAEAHDALVGNIRWNHGTIDRVDRRCGSNGAATGKGGTAILTNEFGTGSARLDRSSSALESSGPLVAVIVVVLVAVARRILLVKSRA